MHLVRLAAGSPPVCWFAREFHSLFPSRPILEVTFSCRSSTVSEDFSLRSLPEFVGWSLGSSALRSCRLSPAVFATMASADSCPALTVQVSPSKVFKLSTRFVRLYLLLLSVTLGFRVCLHTHRQQAASLPVRVPTTVSLLIASFGSLTSRPRPCFSLRLLSLLPINSFHLISLNPCRAHELRAQP